MKRIRWKQLIFVVFVFSMTFLILGYFWRGEDFSWSRELMLGAVTGIIYFFLRGWFGSRFSKSKKQ